MNVRLAALPLIALLAACQAKFDDTNIAKLKEEITRQATAKGLQVRSITFDEVSDLKVAGRATLIDPKAPGDPLLWRCGAEMTEDSTFKWHCAPNEVDLLKGRIRETISAQGLEARTIALVRQANGDYDGSVDVADPARPGTVMKWTCHAARDPGTSGDSANFKWTCKP